MTSKKKQIFSGDNITSEALSGCYELLLYIADVMKVVADKNVDIDGESKYFVVI